MKKTIRRLRRYLKRVLNALLNRKTPPQEQPAPQKIYYFDRPYEIHLDPAFKPLSGKTAIITGASGWLGTAISKRLAAEGAHVYLVGRNQEVLTSLQKQLQADGFCASVGLVDIKSYTDIRAFVDSVYVEREHIDILVNCAGGSARDRMKEIIHQDTSVIDEMLDVNLRGTMLFSKAVGEFMGKSQGGSIVNISSVIAIQGKPQCADYGAAKAGIIGFTKSLAQELGKYAITVNCVSPGIVPRVRCTEAQLNAMRNTNFLNTIGSSEDVASAVAFLAGPEARFITGQNLCVDGGRSLGLHGD